MDIFNFYFENWYTIILKFNWISVTVIIAGVFCIAFLWSIVLKYINRKSINVDQVTLGIGSNRVTLKYNKKDQEIAYKLWVELSTRKIGLEYKPEYDVIVEMYNSWYNFFAVAREQLKDVPAERIKYSSELIELTEAVLNKGLRPHLTIWQAKFRKWYDLNEDSFKDETPQQTQKKYPDYDFLMKDLLSTNQKMIEYKKLMGKIAFQ